MTLKNQLSLTASTDQLKASLIDIRNRVSGDNNLSELSSDLERLERDLGLIKRTACDNPKRWIDKTGEYSERLYQWSKQIEQVETKENLRQLAVELLKLSPQLLNLMVKKFPAAILSCKIDSLNKK